MLSLKATSLPFFALVNDNIPPITPPAIARPAIALPGFKIDVRPTAVSNRGITNFPIVAPINAN